MLWFFWLQSMWDPSSPVGGRTRSPCIGRWTLNNWASTRVPSVLLWQRTLCSSVSGLPRLPWPAVRLRLVCRKVGLCHRVAAGGTWVGVMLVTVASKAVCGPLLALFLADVDYAVERAWIPDSESRASVLLPPSSLTTLDCDSEGCGPLLCWAPKI